jgi:hypothetical protein
MIAKDLQTSVDTTFCRSFSWMAGGGIIGVKLRFVGISLIFAPVSAGSGFLSII